VEMSKADAEKYANIFVAEVKNYTKHSNADRLRVVELECGGKLITPIVCGASNFEAGDKVALALVGAEVIDGHKADGSKFTITAATIRGVTSQGMICSKKELGLGEDHTGILVLPKDAQSGTPLSDVLGGGKTDELIELDLVTTNRSDIVSHRGMAREIAAVTGSKFSDVAPKVKLALKKKRGKHLSVGIKDVDLCSRYIGVVLDNVKIGPSPKWLTKKLSDLGVKAINNVVDITNFVMLEYGNPLHAFDAEKLVGKQIVIRRARKGETLKTLDEVGRELSADTLVIADAEKPVALAGVMGGTGSAINPNTHRMILESATFNPISIRTTSRALGLSTESSQRFVKGLPPSLAELAARRAVDLLIKLAGAKVVEAVEDGKYSNKPKDIVFPIVYVSKLLGVSLSAAQIKKVLAASGFRVNSSGKNLKVAPPSERTDMRIPEDVIEEIGRLYGYDKIGQAPLPFSGGAYTDDPAFSGRDRVRELFVNLGCNEVYNYSFVSAQDLSATGNAGSECVAIANPLSEDQAFLRPNLVANMLKTVGLNLRYREQLRLFELGKVFRLTPKGYTEQWALAAAISGKSSPVEIFRVVKGLLESAATELLDDEFTFLPTPSASPVFAASAVIGFSGGAIGVAGMLKDSLLDRYGISQPVGYFQIDLEKLFDKFAGLKPFPLISRFPTITYDVSAIFPKQHLWNEISATVRRFAGKELSALELFDEYSGKNIPTGKRSLAFHLVFQSFDRTLREEEVKRIYSGIVAMLEKQFNAQIRKS
jgi:phenylalanyl-tRNA synthetase beta chain